MNQATFENIVEAVADKIINAGTDKAAIQAILLREITGFLRVHNDDVRQTISSILRKEARKWHDRYGDDPFDKQYWVALFDADVLLSLAHLPHDISSDEISN